MAVNDPISLSIFLSSEGEATGWLYLDDGQSYDYRNGNKFIYGKFDYQQKVLSYRFNKGEPSSNTAWLEKVTIVGLPTKPNKVVAVLDGVAGQPQQPTTLAFKYDGNTHQLIIRKPAVSFGQSWQIKIL